MTKSISHLVHINGIGIGDRASPEAQQALQRIAENLTARGIDLQADEKFDMTQELDILTQLSALEIKPQVQPSRIPIIGGLITRIKQALHQLVLFYVRDLAAQQNAFNAQVIRVVKKMSTMRA